MSKENWYGVLFLLDVIVFGAADTFGLGVIAFVPVVLFGCYLLTKMVPKDNDKNKD